MTEMVLFLQIPIPVSSLSDDILMQNSEMNKCPCLSEIVSSKMSSALYISCQSFSKPEYTPKSRYTVIDYARLNFHIKNILPPTPKSVSCFTDKPSFGSFNVFATQRLLFCFFTDCAWWNNNCTDQIISHYKKTPKFYFADG